MKIFFLTAFSILASLAYSQSNFYVSPKFDEISKSHKIIGILPFKTTVTLRPKDMRNMNAEELYRLELTEGLHFQQALYSWYLRRQSHGDMTVKVQDIKLTDEILQRNGITSENISAQTPAELAKMLKVDAVISGDFETNKPLSEKVVMPGGLLGGISAPANKAVMNFKLCNGTDGEILINYNRWITGSIGSSPTDLVNILMKNASRKICYPKNDT